MDKKYGMVYIITNLINKKQYVGQTIRTLNDRKYRHFYDALKYHSETPFHRALRKHGIKKFKWIPIEYPIEELDEMESFWIKQLNTLAPNGYNLDSGGSKNKIIAECVKKRLSKNHRPMNGKNNHFYGKKHKLSSIKKMKKSRKKYLKNHPEVIKEMSKRMKEKMTGIKKPMGELNKLSKKCLLISPIGKKYIIIGLKDFCRKYKLTMSEMSRVLRSKEKYHKGWAGKYL
jgi:group I intron endonuclease